MPRDTAPPEAVEDTALAIRGVVVDERGVALNDVTVTAEHDVWSGSENWNDTPPRAAAFTSARTGDDGRFVLPLPIPAFVTVRAQRSDRVPAIARGVAPDSELRLSLSAAATLEGDVLDRVDRTGVPDALVRVMNGDELTVTRTDGVGRFRVEGLAPGTIAVFALPDTHVGSRQTEVHVIAGATARTEMLVERGRDVIGTVRDAATREPIVGARVSAWEFRGKTVATDDQGRFRIDGVGLLGGTIVADAHGYGRSEHELGAGSPDDEPLELEFRLAQAIRLTGRIVDPSGEPIAGAIVVASGRDEFDNPDGFNRREWRETDAGDDGRFVIEGARSDIDLAVQARAPGYGARSFHAAGPDAPRSVELGDLVSSPQATLAGRVVDHLGAPVPGVYVGLHPKVPTAAFDVMHRMGGTDGAGRFFFAGLDAGVVVVRLIAPNSRVELLEVELHEGEHVTDFVVALSGGATLRGRVIDAASGMGLRAALVILSRADELPPETLRAPCDAAGEFELLAVPAGEWIVRAHPPSRFDRAQPPEFDSLRRMGVVADGTYLELALPRLDAELHGRVVDAHDGPAPQRFVARLLGGEPAGDSGALTDDEGRFTLRVPSGVPMELAAFVTAPIEANDSLSVLDLRIGRRVLLDGGHLARVKATADANDVTLRLPGN